MLINVSVKICIKFCSSLRSYKSDISVCEDFCVVIDLFLITYLIFLHYFKFNHAFNILVCL